MFDRTGMEEIKYRFETLDTQLSFKSIPRGRKVLWFLFDTEDKADFPFVFWKGNQQMIGFKSKSFITFMQSTTTV